MGLYYYNARYYLASVGRFISADDEVPDPLDPQDFSRYIFVRNNPVKYIDPSGHSWLSHSASKAFSWVDRHSFDVGVSVQVFSGSLLNGAPFLAETERGQNLLAIEIIAATAVATFEFGTPALYGALGGEVSGAYGAQHQGGSLLVGVSVGGVLGATSAELGAMAGEEVAAAIGPGILGAFLSGATEGAIAYGGQGASEGFGGDRGNRHTFLNGLVQGAELGAVLNGALSTYHVFYPSSSNTYPAKKILSVARTVIPKVASEAGLTAVALDSARSAWSALSLEFSERPELFLFPNTFISDSILGAVENVSFREYAKHKH